MKDCVSLLLLASTPCSSALVDLVVVVVSDTVDGLHSPVAPLELFRWIVPWGQPLLLLSFLEFFAPVSRPATPFDEASCSDSRIFSTQYCCAGPYSLLIPTHVGRSCGVWWLYALHFLHLGSQSLTNAVAGGSSSGSFFLRDALPCSLACTSSLPPCDVCGPVLWFFCSRVLFTALVGSVRFFCHSPHSIFRLVSLECRHVWWRRVAVALSWPIRVSSPTGSTHVVFSFLVCYQTLGWVLLLMQPKKYPVLHRWVQQKMGHRTTAVLRMKICNSL